MLNCAAYPRVGRARQTAVALRISKPKRSSSLRRSMNPATQVAEPSGGPSSTRHVKFKSNSSRGQPGTTSGISVAWDFFLNFVTHLEGDLRFQLRKRRSSPMRDVTCLIGKKAGFFGRNGGLSGRDPSKPKSTRMTRRVMISRCGTSLIPLEHRAITSTNKSVASEQLST